MSRTLSFVPDEEIACELRRKYPLPFDRHTVYADGPHKYGLVEFDVRGDPLYTEEHIIGTTTLIHKYELPFDQYGWPNKGTRGKFKKVYEAWLKSDKPLPRTDEKFWWVDYQEYIPLDIWEKMFHVLRGNVTFVDAFRQYFEYEAVFRVIREQTEGRDKFSDELIAKFDAWERETKRDPDKYMEYLSPDYLQCFDEWERETNRDPKRYMEYLNKDYLKCFRFPPYIYPTDIANYWNGLTIAGTDLHRRIELFYNGHELPPSNEKTWLMFQEFNDTEKPNIVRTELNVAYPELRVCGQIDAVALAPDGKSLIMYDWKRTKKLKSLPELDTDYNTCVKENKYMLPPWDHLLNTARNRYMIQQNKYIFMFYCMVEYCKRMANNGEYVPQQKHPDASDIDLTKLRFSAAYLTVIHVTNSGHILIDLQIFAQGDRNWDAMMRTFKIRKIELMWLISGVPEEEAQRRALCEASPPKKHKVDLEDESDADEEEQGEEEEEEAILASSMKDQEIFIDKLVS